LEDDLPLSLGSHAGRPDFYLKESTMAWPVLIVAGLLEVVWAYTMKLSHGFTRLGPSFITLLAMIASFAMLAYAMRTLPLGTAYTVWTGIGAIGAFVVGIVILNEPANLLRVLAAALIVSGLILMKIASPG
jgi:quaternary ammonium compound-resistance protein SugE